MTTAPLIDTHAELISADPSPCGPFRRYYGRFRLIFALADGRRRVTDAHLVERPSGSLVLWPPTPPRWNASAKCAALKSLKERTF